MSKFYTYDYWVKNFKPIQNPNNDWGGGYSAFETFGEDMDFVNSQPANRVWTEVDGDSGTYVIAGKCWVNRIQYYVTEVPWDSEHIEVPSECWRECDCITEENDYEPALDCASCGEEGTIRIPIETVEDLKAIYGPNANIIG